MCFWTIRRLTNVDDSIKKLRIKNLNMQEHIANLSGGNQQKVLSFKQIMHELLWCYYHHGLPHCIYLESQDQTLTANNPTNILQTMSSSPCNCTCIAGCIITAGCDLVSRTYDRFCGCIAGTPSFRKWITPTNFFRI